MCLPANNTVYVQSNYMSSIKKALNAVVVSGSSETRWYLYSPQQVGSEEKQSLQAERNRAAAKRDKVLNLLVCKRCTTHELSWCVRVWQHEVTASYK